MKRGFLIAGLASMMLFLWSCSKQQGDQVLDGTMVDVTFAVDVEGALATRAISDGNGATQLMWGIFTEDGVLIIPKQVRDNVAGLLTDAGYSFTMSLAKGKTYRAAFWAQNPECAAYTVSDDMKVTVDYAGVNNDESRDAFFATTDAFTVGALTVVSAVLKRPFAQINVGTYAWDLEYAKESEMDVQTSAASVKSVPNVINLFDGGVEGAVDVEYSLAALPAEQLYVDVDEDGTDEEYVWLSMSYILAPAEGSLYAMSFTFADAQQAGPFTFGEGLGTVPAQRNWRTNIVGQVLTGEIAFNVKIDPVYAGESLDSGGLYYNFSEDVLVENKLFAFNTLADVIFTSENNNLLTFNDVEFSGKAQYIAFGDYRNKGNYVSFRNELNNVTVKDMEVTHSKGISNVPTIDYMAPLVFLRGVSVANDCEFTGTTSTAPDIADPNGKMQPVLPYDCGVPNSCEATFNRCKVGSLYTWSHSKVTVNDSEVAYIRCSTHKRSNHSAHLTIGAGTVVDEICVTSSGTQGYLKDENGNYIINPETGKKVIGAAPWSPSLIVKAGARVRKLDYNGRPNEHVIIEDGAVVDEIVNLAE